MLGSPIVGRAKLGNGISRLIPGISGSVGSAGREGSWMLGNPIVGSATEGSWTLSPGMSGSVGNAGSEGSWMLGSPMLGSARDGI
jgi:hypothetical protein